MFKQILVVFLKEMKDLLRDKKTFLFGLIIPLLLLPIILFIVDYSMNSSQKKMVDNIYIGVNNSNNSFYEFCNAEDAINILTVENSKSSMESGRIAAYITINENLDEDIVNKKDIDLDVSFNTSSINSMMSAPLIVYYKELFITMSKYLVDNNYVSSVDDLKSMISNKDLIKVFKESYPYQNATQGLDIDTSSLYFNMLVPMMLILYCCIGSSSTASDLSAGEKERGTLEALLSTGASRTSIIIGKLFATTAMGLFSGLCTVIGLSIYLVISSGTSVVRVSVVELLVLLAITLFTAMFFASVNLTIGVYSRSSKEAQTYLMPVSIISILPTYFTYTLDVNQIGVAYLCMPIMNIVCIIKEVFAGAVNYLHLGIVITWLIIYISIAFSLTAHLFKKESVVFRI